MKLGEWRVSKLENSCLYLPLLFPSSKPPCCDLPSNWTKSSEYFSRELPLLGGEDLRALHSDLNDKVCDGTYLADGGEKAVRVEGGLCRIPAYPRSLRKA